ncbi:hypothetical protein [Nocardia bhagyanarayanae]|uniref:hypothetical protein n=1 Tax=Nocardia bhagyanarayanae TaxID=1215925 RepID=UPI00115048BF|nr:hypothetical protein [Nocardia bhagyanarayanae]
MHRSGATNAPATVVYLQRGDLRSWHPITTGLHARLGGGIAQISYHRHEPGPRRTNRGNGPQYRPGPADIDEVVAAAAGSIILVATGPMCALAQSWAAARCRGDAQAVSGIVMLNPQSWTPGALRAGGEVGPQPRSGGTTFAAPEVAVLREIPTWVMAGAAAGATARGYASGLAASLWADYITVPESGTAVEVSHPSRVVDTILTALDVAYRSHRYGSPT